MSLGLRLSVPEVIRAAPQGQSMPERATELFGRSERGVRSTVPEASEGAVGSFRSDRFSLQSTDSFPGRSNTLCGARPHEAAVRAWAANSDFYRQEPIHLTS